MTADWKKSLNEEVAARQEAAAAPQVTASKEGWQQRLIAERDELAVKLGRLGLWLSTAEGNQPGTEEHTLAVNQYSGMEMYLQALEARIKKL